MSPPPLTAFGVRQTMAKLATTSVKVTTDADSVVEREPSSSRSRGGTLVHAPGRWFDQARGLPRQPSPEGKAEEEAKVRDLRTAVDEDIPAALGLKMADAWLAEARAIYDHREARLARVEARATTLRGTVSVAVPLTLAAAALILDPNKVEDVGWRTAMAVLALLLVGALVVTGWYAARAALKSRERVGPQGMRSRRLQGERSSLDKAPSDPVKRKAFEEERVAHHLREQVVDLLVAADQNKRIDAERTSLLIQGRAYFHLALAVLLVFAIVLAAYAVIDRPTAGRDGGAKAGAPAQR